MLQNTTHCLNAITPIFHSDQNRRHVHPFSTTYRHAHWKSSGSKGKKDKELEWNFGSKKNSFFLSFPFLNNAESITAPIVEFLSYFLGRRTIWKIKIMWLFCDWCRKSSSSLSFSFLLFIVLISINVQCLQNQKFSVWHCRVR